jgi:hypothetical protein
MLFKASVIALLASTNAYTIGPVAARSPPSTRYAGAEMVLGYKVAAAVGTSAIVGTVIASKKIMKVRSSDETEKARAALAGMR